LETLNEIDKKIIQLSNRKLHREQQPAKFFEEMEKYKKKEDEEAKAKEDRELTRQNVARRKLNDKRKRPFDPDDMFAVSKQIARNKAHEHK
jgi:hypothetical protein